MPETSIVIRTFNEEKHLGNLLRALKQQDYQDYEIIVVDSGSTDRTLEIAKESANSVLQIESRDFTFGYSLNLGCRQSQGKYIVFISAHVLPKDNKWLGNLLAPFQNEKVAMVYGRQIGGKDNKFSDQRDLKRLFSDTSGYVNNANSALRKKIWQARPFDEYLFGLEDIEWAKYVIEKGFLAVYEPKAAIFHFHNEKWPQIFNRYRREAIAAARIGLSHPPQAHPDFLWFIASLFQDFLASLPNISPSRLEEIFRFRYFQWKGTRQGWCRDRGIDLNRDKYAFFYPAINQAVVIKNKHQAQIEDVALPEIKPGDVLIQVSHVGVCKTDLEVYEGTLGYYKKGQAHYPIVPGHEFSGTIVQIGASAKYRERFKAGDRVVGECILSLDDSARREVGVINYNGAYAQFIVMPGSALHKIPPEVRSETAVLAEPLAVVLRAVKRMSPRLKSQEKIAVIGAGPIGNLCSQVLINLGHQVSIFDKNQERLAFFKDGAALISQEIKNLQDFSVIVEATGQVAVLKQVLTESRIDATLLLLGFPYGDINYNFEDVVGKEKMILGSVGGGPYEFDEALQLLPKLETTYLTQTILPLAEFQKAWQMQESGKHLKIILKP